MSGFSADSLEQAVVVDGLDRHQLRERRRAAKMIAVVVRDNQMIDLLQPDFRHQLDDAARVASACVAGVDEEGFPAGVTISVAAPPSTSTQYTSSRLSEVARAQLLGGERESQKSQYRRKGQSDSHGKHLREDNERITGTYDGFPDHAKIRKHVGREELGFHLSPLSGLVIRYSSRWARSSIIGSIVFHASRRLIDLSPQNRRNQVAWLLAAGR